jgi:predicted DNA-binding transcriptional regulator AlpA
MVRRLRVESDVRQLGLFGDGLALGVKPKGLKALPIVPSRLEVAKVVPILKPRPSIIGEPAKPKSLSSLPSEIMRPPEAATLLSVSLGLLKKWRLTGSGPRFVRLGGRAIGYRRVDLLAWIEGLTR